MQGLGALSYKLSVLRACDAHQAQRRRFVRDWSAARSTGDRTRTYDLHHVKVLLYQLSYLRFIFLGDGQGWIRTIESKR